jgi:hypothetical protein
MLEVLVLMNLLVLLLLAVDVVVVVLPLMGMCRLGRAGVECSPRVR